MRYSVAIVIPAYKPDFALLDRALASIHAATTEALSIIAVVVDDGSPLGSRAGYPAIRRKYPGLSVVLRDTNSGPGPSRNAGIAYALEQHAAKVVGFLDADDYFCPGWELLPEALTRDRRNEVYTAAYYRNRIPMGIDPIGSLADWKQGPFTRITSVFVKSEFLRTSQIRFQTSRVGEDTEFIFRLLIHSRWRHFPLLSSLYVYDFKDHLAYPHPLATLVQQYETELRAIGAGVLFDRALWRNERNGLLLRAIKPREARYIGYGRALSLYWCGKRLRGYAKRLLKLRARQHASAD